MADPLPTSAARGEPITGTLYVYDHDFAPVMRGRWKSRVCSECANDVMNHWNVGVATASQIGGRPEDYLTVLEQAP